MLQENLSLIGPAQRLTGRASVPFSRLGEFPLIVPQRGQVFRKLIEAQAALLQVKLDVAWEVSSVPAILDLVRGGHRLNGCNEASPQVREMVAICCPPAVRP